MQEYMIRQVAKEGVKQEFMIRNNRHTCSCTYNNTFSFKTLNVGAYTYKDYFL